ncbi:hypothetical protein [Fibrella forsythiae]|uniref:DUF5666 domain-containing protein n=1 Tax=Fibrella forsythiae TaxID=2817061 RepID=A0ABS3JF81_9BACT|nr:hypothetical protein [Fibrella forsythiae]MBO0948648.1 hypothetical protein [Fibrella forsythiae]
MKSSIITLSLVLAALATAHAQNSTESASQAPAPPTYVPTPDGAGPDGPGFAKGNRKGMSKHKGDRLRDGFGPQGGLGQAGRPGKMGRKGGPEGRSHGLTSLTTVTGTVGELTGNDDYILNGFTLSGNAAPAMSVQFPAHLGQQVQKAVKAGSSVSVTGFADTTPDGETRFHMTSLTAGKTTVFDAPPAVPANTPPTPVLTTTTGKITDYKLDRKGRVNGLEINDNTIIRVPPHIAYQLTNLAKKGTDITVQGYATPMRDGQVQLQKVNILRASVLTINGQQYLVR